VFASLYLCIFEWNSRLRQDAQHPIARPHIGILSNALSLLWRPNERLHADHSNSRPSETRTLGPVNGSCFGRNISALSFSAWACSFGRSGLSDRLCQVGRSRRSAESNVRGFERREIEECFLTQVYAAHPPTRMLFCVRLIPPLSRALALSNGSDAGRRGLYPEFSRRTSRCVQTYSAPVRQCYCPSRPLSTHNPRQKISRPRRNDLCLLWSTLATIGCKW
jgi:hypothetical protein